MQPLCEILNISVNDLLNGEESTLDNKNTGKAVVDYLKYYKEKHRLKNCIIAIVVFSIFIISILGIYFINNYNKIKIFKMSGESENFSYINSYLISSNKKNMYIFGDVINNKQDIIIKNVYLKYKDKKLCGGTYNNSLSVAENIGYDEIFNKQNITDLDNWYIEIEYSLNNEEKTETIGLEKNQEFTNDSFFLNSTPTISDNNSDKTEFDRRWKESLDQISVLEDLLIKNKFTSHDNTLYEKWISDSKYLNVMLKPSPVRIKCSYHDKDFYVDFDYLHQTYNFSSKNNDFSFSFYRKNKSVNCYKGTCPTDMYTIANNYLDIFDKELSFIENNPDNWKIPSSEE